MPLRQFANSFDGLIADIYSKRDYVLKQMKNKECVSSAQMKILINAMVHQIVDNTDIKPELNLLEKLVNRDPHQCFNDEINRERGLRMILDAKVKEMETNLQLEIKQKNEFRLLYEDCLRTSLRQELQFKIDIESKNKEIEELKTKLSSMSGKDSEQVLRQRCLASKPFVVLERRQSNDRTIRSIEFNDTSHSSSDPQRDTNDVQSDNVSKNSDVNTNSKPNQTKNQAQTPTKKKIIEIVIDEYYSRVETRSGIKYKCDWNKCLFKSLSCYDMIKHINVHKRKNPFICDKNGCGKAFLNENYLTKHKQTHSPNSLKQQMKSRLENIVDNREASTSSSKQHLVCEIEDSNSSDVCEYIGVKQESSDRSQTPNDFHRVLKKIKTEST